MKKSFDLCNPCHRKLIFDLVMRKFSYSEDDIHLLVSQAVGEAGTFFTYKCDRDCDWYERFEIEAYFVEVTIERLVRKTSEEIGLDTRIDPSNDSFLWFFVPRREGRYLLPLIEREIPLRDSKGESLCLTITHYV